MSHYTCYLSLEKLKRAIWCELFVIHEGYIPCLKKWIKLQEQTRAEVKDDLDDNEIHSDIQYLVPGGPLKFDDSQKLTKSEDTTRPFGDKN